ncbi:hypothetical protein CK203_044203 [Vitis vinifera]|uniref:Reverse transcriptase domain-containing protein n=1 Tax=Vitis vinifera TaxID=29760 RepID=A0A438I2T2_VITVI|nr:hypothetical protein CK203_044203 [Vitis vinifera]
MSEGLVRTLGSRRFLDWGVMGAQGAAGGILICWDKMTLEVLEMEMGQFSISCRLRNIEMRLFGSSQECTGGDFNVTLYQKEMSNQGRLTGAMRRFAQVVDELELLDLPLQEGVSHGAGCRLSRPTSAHFPILLKGGGLRRGPSLFRFENMWLKVDRDVFGKLEVNKNSALQQVALWNGVESERSLIEGETELKRELLSEEPGWRADIEGLHLQSLNRNEVKVLELPFTEKEIHSSLMEMNGDKAPSPDGFTVAFWQYFLIPKKGGAEDLGNFRPINLLRGLYKLLAKVLANRLKKVLLQLQGVALRRSLSPYLFVLGMEVLSVLIRRVVDGFISARKEHLTSLSWILAWFEAASGLRINLTKSEVISVGEVEDIDELEVELGCRVGSLRTVYLGLPLGANHKASSMRVVSFEGLEDFFRRGLSDMERRGSRFFLIRDAYKLLAAPSAITFPKKAFGWIRFQPKLLFLLGKARGRRS